MLIDYVTFEREDINLRIKYKVEIDNVEGFIKIEVENLTYDTKEEIEIPIQLLEKIYEILKVTREGDEWTFKG